MMNTLTQLHAMKNTNPSINQLLEIARAGKTFIELSENMATIAHHLPWHASAVENMEKAKQIFENLVSQYNDNKIA